MGGALRLFTCAEREKEAHPVTGELTPRVWCKNWESRPDPATQSGCWEQVESKGGRVSHYNEREERSLQVDRTDMMGQNQAEDRGKKCALKAVHE